MRLIQIAARDCESSLISHVVDAFHTRASDTVRARDFV